MLDAGIGFVGYYVAQDPWVVTSYKIFSSPVATTEACVVARTSLIGMIEGPIDAVNTQAKSADSLGPDQAGDKLLFVIGSLDVGGTERHLALLAPRLARWGWKPVVYCLARPGPQAREIAQAGVQV